MVTRAGRVRRRPRYLPYREVVRKMSEKSLTTTLRESRSLEFAIRMSLSTNRCGIEKRLVSLARVSDPLQAQRLSSHRFREYALCD